MNFKKFLAEVKQIYATNSATEHSYRPALRDLLSSIDPDVGALNEPKREKCGAPDFILSRNGIPVGHVEAKDPVVGIHGLNGVNKKQQERYLAALPNLIYTDCLDWDFYRDGELVASVAIADCSKGVAPKPGRYDELENLLRDFITQKPQIITSPRDLAERMAGKASLIKDVMFNALKEDKGLETELSTQYEAFKKKLIHDITPDRFADVYAETIAYGMFAARLHDPTPETFSRQEALDLLPKSYPFLRSLFGYVAGHNLDERIAWIIDDLARVFQACDMGKLMKGFNKLTGQDDPFLHFYETFLAAYNPSKRKACGVWYTPKPVVKFIVRAVDEVLQTEFGLPDGLASEEKLDGEGDHRVQILDPATGTGTFLAEAIKRINRRIKRDASGMKSSYIENHLIPRLHGFEMLMASYAMCHVRIGMVLTKMGYKPSGKPPRFSVFLTNSLEEGESNNPILPFARWLSDEAEGANAIKRDKSIMCVIGNPPYSAISRNKGEWISDLIEDYKYVDGVHFGERKHWLHDDYVKFIRMSESLIEKNGTGILGFITNHGYLDNPTFRGMRWHLLKTFDRIHVIDLHGNADKKEVAPEGQTDKNVFDIKQGVAIIIAVKTGKRKEELAEVWHGDLWGTREDKYASLKDGRIETLAITRIEHKAPQYIFSPQDHSLDDIYGKGFRLGDFMPAHVTGIVTAKDGLVIDFTKRGLKDKIERFVDPTNTDEQVRADFFPKKKTGKYPSGDSRGWKLPEARVELQNDDWESDITTMAYRPFDTRAVLYRANMVDWPRFDVMRHMLNGDNIALVSSRQAMRLDSGWNHVLVTKHVFDNRGIYTNRGTSFILPLYLYPEEQDLDQTRRVNFDPKLYAKLRKIVGRNERVRPPAPPVDEIQVFDYIYGVLHCPAYRETYAEFLKTDFPRIPWPTSPDEFWDVSAKGAKLRKLHLMEPDAIGPTPFPFTTLEGEDGDNVVDKPCFEDGCVWINDTQCFEDAPPVSWNFFIGGYKPAQKWLKDRKGRELTFDDVKHYQRILKVLSETDRIMRTIEMASIAGPAG